MERLPGLGRQAEWRLVEVGLIRCGVVKALVRSAAVVEIEISADRGGSLADIVVGSQVFNATPQPLDEDVVPRAPLPSMLMAMPWSASRPVKVETVLTVDHRFALSNPALVSAPSKKSFSSVSSPISERAESSDRRRLRHS